MSKIIAKRRGEGKTTRLVYLSELTGYPIVTNSRIAAANIKELASRCHADIPDPIVASSLMESMKGRHVEGLLVDDIDHVLQSIINTPIFAATVTV